MKYIYFVGGRDGAKLGCDYYTQFVEKTSRTPWCWMLACGKFRFNHLQDQLGDTGAFPACSDMASATTPIPPSRSPSPCPRCSTAASTTCPLAGARYERAAVQVLLTLLSLGIKNIRIGPSLPAFVSPTVLNVLVEKFGLTPISTPDEDLKALAG